MPKRFLAWLAAVALAILGALLVWQGSFSFGNYGPATPAQTELYWAVSTLVFLLTVTLAFMLFRTGVKLYIERRTNKEGSRIRTRLVVGALTLSFLPGFFLVIWSVYVLNRNLDKWFSRPAEGIRTNLAEARRALKEEMPAKERAEALAAAEREFDRYLGEYDQLALDRKSARNFYLLLLALITLFVLFVATWIALFLARQISVPISALLAASAEVGRGNLGHRIQAQAIDELATLVQAFNNMTQALETNTQELERRRRFTEAVLESIPSGVLSLAPDGRILMVNGSLKQMFGEARVGSAKRLEDLFTRDETADIKHLMKRARRSGVASTQMESSNGGQARHLAVTVAALEAKLTSGFVAVLEDTSELLRAQKAAAWHEVARRLAHEIKNPLTPITLSAERMKRLVGRAPVPPDVTEMVGECTATIVQEVESLKTLLDEFAQFARFPAPKPAPSDLNEVVELGLGVFAGRLDGIELRKELSPGLPQVSIDREQFKRVIVNLVDNAAEAMRESHVRRLFVATHSPTPETVELIIADTGCGISPQDKEKLFLPYFSTKGRGTGLGLAIVSHVLADHHAHVRVEDNIPSGARFIVEIPAVTAAEPEGRAAEVRA
jgi:PAS domain S-box-containing protein